MRVLIATTGTDGDVRPFLALARELRARRHEVVLAAPDRFAPSAAEHGVAFRKIGTPWNAEELSRTLSRALRKSNPLAQVAIIVESLAERQQRMLPDLLAIVPEHDVVVYPPLLVAAAAGARAPGPARLRPAHASSPRPVVRSARRQPGLPRQRRSVVPLRAVASPRD